MTVSAVRKVDWIDPKVFECERKKPYPLQSMAERAADGISKESGAHISAYRCKFCDKWHIGGGGGGKSTQDHVEKTPYKFFFEYEGLTLAKVRDEFGQYIFAVPPGTPENDVSVMERGVLVAYKKRGDVFREKGGVKSEHYSAFSHIFPFHARDLVRFREKTEAHEEFMEDFTKVTMDFLNGVRVPSLTERVQSAKKEKDHATAQREFAAAQLAEEERLRAEEEQRKIAGQEMYNGRAVFRNAEGFKPYHRDLFKCCAEGCDNEVELRAYIRHDGKGHMTSVAPRVPLDPRAMRRMSSKTAWICGDCMARVANPTKVSVDTEQEYTATDAPNFVGADNSVAAVAAGQPEPEPELSTGIMSDLKRIALDPSIDASFVRGALLMALVITETR